MNREASKNSYDAVVIGRGIGGLTCGAWCRMVRFLYGHLPNNQLWLKRMKSMVCDG